MKNWGGGRGGRGGGKTRITRYIFHFLFFESKSDSASKTCLPSISVFGTTESALHTRTVAYGDSFICYSVKHGDNDGTSGAWTEAVSAGINRRLQRQSHAPCARRGPTRIDRVAGDTQTRGLRPVEPKTTAMLHKPSARKVLQQQHRC